MKTKDEMEEYFLQLAAYAKAHDWQYKTKIESIIVFLAIRNGQYKKTSISLDELENYKLKWLSRLIKFEEDL
jgi:genome maintenance exonuclease 1